MKTSLGVLAEIRTTVGIDMVHHNGYVILVETVKRGLVGMSIAKAAVTVALTVAAKMSGSALLPNQTVIKRVSCSSRTSYTVWFLISFAIVVESLPNKGKIKIYIRREYVL